MSKFQIQQATSQIIFSLAGGKQIDKAALAHLRNSPSVLNPQAQHVWPLLLSALPSRELSINGMPTKAELAVFASLRMFANYQQGHDDLRYAPSWPKDEADGITVFSALSQMRQTAEDQDRLDRRVGALLAMTNLEAVVNALIHLIDILKGSKSQAQLDFARLAQDLYDFQWSFENANRVRLAWGREYYRYNVTKAESEGEKAHD